MALTFSLMALAWFYVGTFHWLGWWAGFAFAGVALGYARMGGTLFGKSPNGRLSWLAWLILAPYHLLSHLSAWLGSGRLAYHEVVPGLYLGRRLNEPEAREGISKLGWSAVLDLTAEFSETPALRGLPYLNFSLLDKTSPSLEQLQAGVEFLKQHHGAGRPVYVHCALGHGRSATFVLAYLRQTEEWLRAIRPGVGLAPTQRLILKKWVSQ